MLTNSEAPAAPPQHWSWKKIALWFLAALTVFIVATIVYDEKLQPYDDLMPTRTKAPAAETNGYAFLKQRWENLPKAPAESRSKITKMLAGTEAWDPAWVEQQRVKGVSLADDLKNALLLSEFSTPIYAELRDVGDDAGTWLMHPVRLLFLEMEGKRRSGDWMGALAIRKDLHELGRRHLQGSRSLIALLVGVSINSILCQDTCHLFEAGKTSREQAADLAALWQADLPFIPAWEEAMRHETLLSRNSIELLCKGNDVVPGHPTPLRQRIFFKPNQTINGFHKQRRALLQQAFQISSSPPAPPIQEDEASLRWLRYLNANYYGKMVLDSTGGYEKIIPGMTDNAFFRPRALRVRIAIFRWLLEHPGKLPAKLEELVPDFLPEVPADPWNGQPLQWDPASKIISAVGSDWKYGAAKFNKDSRAWFAEDRDNPGLRMELPPPAPPKPSNPGPKPTKPKSVPPTTPATPAGSK
jgi:hypothetical protein